MDQGFFTIRGHRDMLAKAERELARMEADCNVDSIFNFFVTAYHIMDYVKVSAAPKSAIDLMYADSDFEMCQFICNKGKHLELKKGDKETKFVSGGIDIINIVRILPTGLARTPPRFLVDGREVDLPRIGRDLIAKWNVFFEANGI